MVEGEEKSAITDYFLEKCMVQKRKKKIALGVIQLKGSSLRRINKWLVTDNYIFVVHSAWETIKNTEVDTKARYPRGQKRIDRAIYSKEKKAHRGRNMGNLRQQKETTPCIWH